MPLSKKAQKLLAAAQKAATEPNNWAAIDSNTIRWSRTLPTPDWARKERPTPEGAYRAMWPGETFTQHVFLTLHGFGGGTRNKPKVLKRVVRAPWIQAQDTEISQREALEVLETPEAEFSG